MLTLQDLEKKINSELTTKINSSKISHSQIYVNIDSEDIVDVILFLKNTFEETDLVNCEGKVIGTNVAQGGNVSTGDTLSFIIGTENED